MESRGVVFYDATMGELIDSLALFQKSFSGVICIAEEMDLNYFYERWFLERGLIFRA